MDLDIQVDHIFLPNLVTQVSHVLHLWCVSLYFNQVNSWTLCAITMMSRDPITAEGAQHQPLDDGGIHADGIVGGVE
jgi:hypothetical protein